MKNKSCLITGANSGIGLATAIGLARQGAQVIIVSRHAQRGEEAVHKIKEETGNSAVELLIADLSSLQDIRNLAKQFNGRYHKLDVLINNAGGLFPKQETSVDGFEMTFALNYLAPFLLTHLLLDALKVSEAGRIVNVASRVQSKQLNWNELGQPKTSRYSSMDAYGKAKTALIMMTYYMAKQLTDRNVTVNALHPGVIYTPQATKVAPNFLKPLAKLFMRSPEQGAATSLYLASSPEVEKVTGQYYSSMRAKRSVPVSYQSELQQTLYEKSLHWVGLNS